jgi:hypothetical protein
MWWRNNIKMPRKSQRRAIRRAKVRKMVTGKELKTK